MADLDNVFMETFIKHATEQLEALEKTAGQRGRMLAEDAKDILTRTKKDVPRHSAAKKWMGKNKGKAALIGAGAGAAGYGAYRAYKALKARKNKQ